MLFLVAVVVVVVVVVVVLHRNERKDILRIIGFCFRLSFSSFSDFFSILDFFASNLESEHKSYFYIKANPEKMLFSILDFQGRV